MKHHDTLLRHHYKLATAIAEKAQSQNRNLTPEEKSEVDGHLVRMRQLKDNKHLAAGEHEKISPEGRAELADAGQLQATIDELGFPLSGDSFSLAMKARQSDGFLQGKPVTTSAKAILDDIGDAAPRRLGGIEAMPLDRRYVYPSLVTQDLGGATRIEALVQNARDLASASEMQIPLGASTEKPVSTVGAELADYSPIMIATLSELLPNSIVSKPAFASLVDETLRQAFRESLDSYVVETLYAEAGTTNDEGADLFEELRKARTSLEAQGFAPDLAVVSPEDAETLDLSRSEGATGSFMLSPAPRDVSSSPLWGMKVTSAKRADTPIVMDTRAAAILYTGSVALSGNPFEGFSTNRTRFRLEGPTVLVVRQPQAIHVIAPSGV